MVNSIDKEKKEKKEGKKNKRRKISDMNRFIYV